jgi:hypothetical protein
MEEEDKDRHEDDAAAHSEQTGEDAYQDTQEEIPQNLGWACWHIGTLGLRQIVRK